MPSNFYWRLATNCLEISLAGQVVRTPDVANMSRGLPAALPNSDNDVPTGEEGEERPAKRLKRTIIEEERPVLLWEAATRLRIWVSKELLLEVNDNPNDHEETISVLERCMKAIWEHAPNLTHCSLYAAPYPQSSVEPQDNPQTYYFPMRPLTLFLQHFKRLKALDIVGIACFHNSQEELLSFQQMLREHSLEEVTCVIDVESPISTQHLQQKYTAWASSLFCLKNIKFLHLEGIPYLMNQPDCLRNLSASSLSYLRLDVDFEPSHFNSVVNLITSSSNLSHLSIGLAASGSRKLNNDVALMKRLANAVGNSQVDILRIRSDKQLLVDDSLSECWTDMLKENFSITQFQIAIFTDFIGRVPEQEAEVNGPEQLQKDVDAYIKMNSLARKRIFSPYFELETITNEGWARSLHEICSAELPPELGTSCVYLYMRQRPAEVSNQLLKQYAPKSNNNIEEVPTSLLASASVAARVVGKRKLSALIRSERRFYDLTYELVSLRERLANFQRSIIDTSDKRMKALAVVARIKQVSSGPDARNLSPTLARVYEKATQLVVCLEHHNGTIGESLGLFRTGDGLKTLTTELTQLKTLIQTSFSMLEEIGAVPSA